MAAYALAQDSRQGLAIHSWRKVPASMRRNLRIAYEKEVYVGGKLYLAKVLAPIESKEPGETMQIHSSESPWQKYWRRAKSWERLLA